MYQYTYGEILADSPVGARDQERAVFDHAIGLLRTAEAEAAPAGGAQDAALAFTRQMWSLFIKDLAHRDNDLPPELRAKLMSVGLWVLAEASRIDRGESNGLGAIADVCGVIRDGLH